jgi:DNA polymerase-3 subunit delta
MQIAARDLNAQLARGLRSLYTLHGDEPLLLQEALDTIRAAARAQGYTERTSHTVSGAHFDWSEVLASGGSLSLFADRQIVEIRIPSGKPGKDGSTALQRLAQAAQNNTDLLTIVLLPRLDKATRAAAWFAALEGFGVTLEVQPVERSALPTWIAQRLAVNCQRVEPGEAGQRTLQFFADQVEGNLLAAHQEVQKLALLYPVAAASGANPGARSDAGPAAGKGAGATDGALTFEQVESAVLNVARYDVFKLSEAALSGNRVRVQRMLDGLQAEGVAEVLVHYTLAEDIRSLKRVKDAMAAGRPLPMALRENRVWGNKERLFERVLPRLSGTALTQLLQSAHTVDGIVKGMRNPQWPATGWQALHRLALNLCGLCADTSGAALRH